MSIKVLPVILLALFLHSNIVYANNTNSGLSNAQCAATIAGCSIAASKIGFNPLQCKLLRTCKKSCRDLKRECKSDCKKKYKRGKQRRKCIKSCRKLKRSCKTTCRSDYKTPDCKTERKKIIGSILKTIPACGKVISCIDSKQ